MSSVVCLHFSIQEEDIVEHTTVKCHLCTLESTCRPLCDVGIHLLKLTLFNILVQNNGKRT